jgi:glutamate dehydrogenase (NAD(P)+)
MATDVLELMDEWGPEKVVCVSDRRSGMRGVLVIDNTARGTGKGGTRMSPTLTVSEVARLARTMTWKWATVDLFHGGAKAGILGDPQSHDKEAVLRAFARALRNEVPAEYVFGLDMGLSEDDASIFLDELGDRGAATGLPRELGGLPYDQLGVTGYGVAEATQAAASFIGLELRGSRISIQGFGAVGSAAAERLASAGATITAVSTVHGAIVDDDGIDVAKLAELRRTYGDDCVLEYGATGESVVALTSHCDVLIPAARQDVIDDELAAATSARLIVEGANMPCTPSALDLLHRRAVTVVPDFIANAGGIIAAAHSMDARYSPFPVDVAEVRQMIADKMRSNTATVLNASVRQGATPHMAGRDVAQGRVLAAMQARRQVV